MVSQSDKAKIARSFSRSAASYDSQAALQRDMGKKLLTMLKGEHKNILDVGCGTGELARALAWRFPLAKIHGIDIAPGMIEQAKRFSGADFSLADGEGTSFSSASYDLIISCAALHWMNLKAFANESSRLLTPGGTLSIATFGPKTMEELRQLGLRVNQFPNEKELQKSFVPFFDDIDILTEERRLHFSSLKEFIAGLRKLGGRQAFQSMGRNKFFPRQILNKELFVSYQIIYLQGIVKK
jgi:malonyl-CoA O-methyltransferase